RRARRPARAGGHARRAHARVRSGARGRQGLCPRARVACLGRRARGDGADHRGAGEADRRAAARRVPARGEGREIGDRGAERLRADRADRAAGGRADGRGRGDRPAAQGRRRGAARRRALPDLRQFRDRPRLCPRPGGRASRLRDRRMSVAVLGFADSAEPAARLAGALGVPCHEVSVHRFPDGESLVRVPEAPETALLYRSLDRPNAKIVELLLAASALRDGGTLRLVLVAPYLAYMRQGSAFRPGEAVSQRVIGGLLAQHCDALITLDPHLHRVASLAEVMPGIEAVSVSAAPVLAAALDGMADPLLVGPDEESRQWVEAIARPRGLE